MQGLNEPDVQLNAALQSLKSEIQQVHVPPQLQAALMQMYDQRYQRPAWWRSLFTPPIWMASAAMASCLVVIVLVQPALKETPLASTQVQLEQSYEEIPFVALESSEMILQQASVRLVRADIPHSVLATMGVVVSPQTAGASSRAEMLVNERDEYLAVRFIPSE